MRKRRKRPEQQREECVTIEAVCGDPDAEERWIRAFDVLAEYGHRAENPKGSDT